MVSQYDVSVQLGPRGRAARKKKGHAAEVGRQGNGQGADRDDRIGTYGRCISSTDWDLEETVWT